MLYDPADVTVIWGGMVLTGMSEDGGVDVTANEDAVIPKTGIQGDTAYSINNNRSGNVKVTLFNTSASLTQLREDAQNRVAKPLTVRNANQDGGYIVSCDDCRILKVPDTKNGKEAEGTEVNFYVPVLHYGA